MNFDDLRMNYLLVVDRPDAFATTVPDFLASSDISAIIQRLPLTLDHIYQGGGVYLNMLAGWGFLPFSVQFIFSDHSIDVFEKALQGCRFAGVLLFTSEYSTFLTAARNSKAKLLFLLPHAQPSKLEPIVSSKFVVNDISKIAETFTEFVEDLLTSGLLKPQVQLTVSPKLGVFEVSD